MSTQAPSALAAWVSLLRAHAALTRTVSAQLLEQHGLTINDYEALLTLSRAEGRRMRRVDLAQGLLLTPSGITRLLDGLERAGLVERAACPADLRVSYAVLTEAGRERLSRASCSHVGAVRGILGERYSDDELAQLAELLGRVGGPADGDECTAGR